MIDLGLDKLALIGVVALVVIGPERLPKVARMAGTLLGRAQRYINDVKSEVSREIELEELRKMQTEVQEAASDVEHSLSQELAGLEGDMREALHNPLLEPGQHEAADPGTAKARAFRKKRLARSSAIPAWYKKQNGRRSHVVSGAARVARHRPASARKSTGSFH